MDSENITSHSDAMSAMERQLERIALALERLATLLESQQSSTLSVPTISPTTSAVEGVTVSTSAASDYLSERGISVKTIPDPSPADEGLDRLSSYLGSKYEHLRELMKRLKQTMQLGGSFRMNVSQLPQESIATICQFCSYLYQAAFLTQYHYLKAPK